MKHSVFVILFKRVKTRSEYSLCGPISCVIHIQTHETKSSDMQTESLTERVRVCKYRSHRRK